MKLEDLLLLGAAVGAGYWLAKRHAEKTAAVASSVIAAPPVTQSVLARVVDPVVIVDDDPYPYGYAYPVYGGGWGWGGGRRGGGGHHGGHGGHHGGHH